MVDGRPDPWLDRWLPLLGAQAVSPAILELGCGEGRDTGTLVQAGFERITALDRRADALAECQSVSPTIRCLIHDLRGPLPFEAARFDGVLASLCLHYFPWPVTEAIVGEVRRVLVPGGLLLCRVNSTGDVNFGAVGFPELDRHYYSVRGRSKRFFDRAEVDALFGAGWERLSTEETTFDRYEKPKVAWEVVAKKV